MRTSPRMSPALSGLLNDVVYKEEAVEMSPEEASLLQEEINNISKQIESDTVDLSIVSKSLGRTLEITKDMNTAVDTDTTDKHTASLLLSEFASIYKDTLGQDFLYPKNLSDNPLEVKQILTAGLQSAKGFIETLKKIIKKIWESLKAAAKWFWSKVKQFINWIFGNKRKAEKIQENNAAVLLYLSSAIETGEEFSEDLANYDTLNDDEKEKLNSKVNIDASTRYKNKLKESGLDQKNEDTDPFLFRFITIERKIMECNILLSSKLAANRLMLNVLNRIESDNLLLSKFSAMGAIYAAGQSFFIGPEGTTVLPKNTTYSILKNYPRDNYTISTIYKNSEEWNEAINKYISSNNAQYERNRELSLQYILSALVKPDQYDMLCGLGDLIFGTERTNGGIVGFLTEYLQDAYSSYYLFFKEINTKIDIFNNGIYDVKKNKYIASEESAGQFFEEMDETKGLISDKDLLFGKSILSAASVPVKISVNNLNKIECEWTNLLVSGVTTIGNIDLNNIKDNLKEEAKTLGKVGYTNTFAYQTDRGIFQMRYGEGFFKKIGSSDLEKELIKNTDKLQSIHEKMFTEVDKYVKWFSEVPADVIDLKRDTFNNLSTMVQHLNKITPSLPLDMLKNNQLVVDSALNSIDFEEEVIRAYKEVLNEEAKNK